MSIYLGVGSTAHKMSKLYVGVGGQARQVQKVYVGINGQARLVYQSGSPIGSLAVGSIVKIKVNGSAKNFIVVHQGKPSRVYDNSCNGTWLLMKDIYENRQWHSSDINSYANSTIHSYLNSTFLNLFESNIKNAIKQVKIPYYKGSGESKTVTSGSNGLSAKIFLLSAAETKIISAYVLLGEGAELAYFEDCSGSADSKRIAYLNGSATSWWIRTPVKDHTDHALRFTPRGDWGSGDCTNRYGIRPCMILPQDALVDKSGNVIG